MLEHNVPLPSEIHLLLEFLQLYRCDASLTDIADWVMKTQDPKTILKIRTQYTQIESSTIISDSTVGFRQQIISLGLNRLAQTIEQAVGESIAFGPKYEPSFVDFSKHLNELASTITGQDSKSQLIKTVFPIFKLGLYLLALAHKSFPNPMPWQSAANSPDLFAGVCNIMVFTLNTHFADSELMAAVRLCHPRNPDCIFNSEDCEAYAP